MATQPENPPAFPSPPSLFIDGDTGMTLRDWFAGQALGSVITAMQTSLIADHPVAGGGLAGFAASAYDIADAMLAERSKATGND